MVWRRLMAASARRVSIWSLLLALGVSLGLLWTLQPLAQAYAPNAGHDFILLYAAAHAVRDHQNPYDPATLLRYARMSGVGIVYLVDTSHHLNQPYVYPPLFAWLVIPLTFFSPAHALVAWRAICALGVFAGTYGVTAPWRNEVGILRTQTHRLIFAGLSVVAPVTVYGLYWGNPVELMYAAMGGWVWLLWRRGQWTDVAAGVLMSASLLKPQLALPMAALSAGCFLWGADAMRRRWRVAKGFLGASLVLLLLDLLVTSPALLLAWPRSILYLARMTNTQSDMPSLLGLLKHYLQQLPVRLYTQITLLVVLVTV
ncbi:MAG: glycosyltransferase 87 family protein, partial [Ktedonobacterales bacterium]